MYKGYQLFIPQGYKKRIFIDGPGISCNEYFYSQEKAKERIDFAIKILNEEFNNDKQKDIA
jgi:hypothetical protein